MTVRRDAELPAPLTGDHLDGLLASLATAESWSIAADLLLRQLADIGGTQHAVLLIIDGATHRLKATHALATREVLTAGVARPFGASGDPLVAAAMSLEAVACSAPVLRPDGIPYERWCAVPVPQPLHRGSLLRVRESDSGFSGRFADCGVVPIGSERRRRVGLSPFAVAVLDVVADPEMVETLAEFACVAGPVVAHLHT